MKKYRCRTNTYKADSMLLDVLIDPVDLPADMEHSQRSLEEVTKWWRMPHVVTNGQEFEARVLDGGAHDRTRSLGTFDTLVEAVHRAVTYRESISEVVIFDGNPFDPDGPFDPIDKLFGDD